MIYKENEVYLEGQALFLIRTGVEPRNDQTLPSFDSAQGDTLFLRRSRFDSAQRPLKGRQDDTAQLYAGIRMNKKFLCDSLRPLRLCVKTGLETLYLFFSLVS